MEGFFNHFKGYVISIIIPISILLSVWALYVGFKCSLCFLRSSKGMESRRKFGHIHLGNTQEIKLLKARNDELENLFVKLNGDQKESDIYQERIAQKVRNLDMQLENVKRSKTSQKALDKNNSAEIRVETEV